MTTEGNFGVVTDKAGHGFLPSYLAIAAELGTSARVCELGVWHGDSLAFWQAVFPFGEVTGVDISPAATWPPGTRQVIADAADPALAEILGGPFDLIVEDAAHFGAQTAAAFAGLWPLVAPGGYYCVEDWYVGIPGNSFYPAHGGDSMLKAVQDFLPMLDSPDAEADSITYRYGLAMVHKRKESR